MIYIIFYDIQARQLNGLAFLLTKDIAYPVRKAVFVPDLVWQWDIRRSDEGF